jgi:hypothetical protein
MESKKSNRIYNKNENRNIPKDKYKREQLWLSEKFLVCKQRQMNEDIASVFVSI